MTNLKSEERIAKIKSASFSLEKYFEYMCIDDSYETIYKKLFSSNSFIDLETLILYGKEKGVNFIKRKFEADEFRNFSKDCFPLIASVNSGYGESFVVITKKDDYSIVIFEDGQKRNVSFEDFFKICNFECISSEKREEKMNVNVFLDKFLSISKNRNKLFITLIIQTIIYGLSSIVATSWLKSFSSIGFNVGALLYLLVCISFTVILVQFSMISKSRLVIKSLSLINDGTDSNFSKTSFVLNFIQSGLLSILMLLLISSKSVTVFFILLISSGLVLVLTYFSSNIASGLTTKMKRKEKEYNSYLESVSLIHNSNNSICSDKNIINTKEVKFKNFVKANFELLRFHAFFKICFSLLMLIVSLVAVFVFRINLPQKAIFTAEVYTIVAFYIAPFVLAFRVFILNLYNVKCIDSTKVVCNKNHVLGKKKVKFENLIFVKNLHFEYMPKLPVLKNINVKIPFGKKVLIYGESGSGKSTLANLILHNLTTNKGEIYIDDELTSDVDLEKFYKQTQFVSEENEIFSASIYDNITCFEQISMKRIVNICKKLDIYKDIQKMPFNFNTVIDKDNVTLSKGLVKKIFIARAVLKNPKFLVIDGVNDVFTSEDIKNINELIDSDTNIKTTLMFARTLPIDLQFDITYKLENGVITKKEMLEV